MRDNLNDSSQGRERIIAAIEIERHGHPMETVTVEFDGEVQRSEVAAKVAAILELEAAEILEELENPEVLHPEHHRGKLKLVCVDLHFETEAAKHHFPASARWERVHRWGCKRFRVASDACANLELHQGSATGPALNEAKRIGHHEDCLVVWLVKLGPERNG